MRDDRYNPILDRMKNGKKTGAAYKRSREQEKETAARIGGRQIAASGSRFRKADVELRGVARIECKATEADSFRVTKEMIRKVEEAGILEGQFPIIDIEFVDKQGKVQYAACVMKRMDLFTLLEQVKAKDDLDPPRSPKRPLKLKQRIGRQNR